MNEKFKVSGNRVEEYSIDTTAVEKQLKIECQSFVVTGQSLVNALYIFVYKLKTKLCYNLYWERERCCEIFIFAVNFFSPKNDKKHYILTK